MQAEDNNDRLFACPIYLQDRQKCRACLRNKLTRICDVRQHMRRHHLQQRHCPRCGQIFDDDPDESKLNHHIRIQQCRERTFSISGITEDQARRIESISRDRSRRSAPQRWFEIWNVIFPFEPVPESPYLSGETPFLQRLLDIRAASGQVRELVPSMPWTNIGQHQYLISDELVNLATLMERGVDGATPLASPTQTSYEMPAPVQAAQGYGNFESASNWTQSPSTRAGGHGQTYSAADTLYPDYTPPLDQDLWMSALMTEGWNQSPPNPPWDAHFDQQSSSH